MNWKTKLLYWWAAKVCKFPYVVVHGKKDFEGISFLIDLSVIKEISEKDYTEMKKAD